VGDVLFGTTMLASVLAGVVALFAPCCISVMLPAYFATGFQRRPTLVAMTFVFAAGVAAVILPIALGVRALTRLIAGQHTVLFSIGGVIMMLMGALVLSGRALRIPMVGVSPRGGRGPGAVFGLGAFSGIASACCAPVLAGVAALSGAVGSFTTALVVGLAYVFGMVAPLFVIALFWSRFERIGRTPLLGRVVTIRLGSRTHRLPMSALASGVLLVGMGVLAMVLAARGPSMASSGWQVELTGLLQHWASNVVSWTAAIPGWVVGVALVAVVAGLARMAARQIDRAASTPAVEPDPTADGGAPASPERSHA
jgi:cytochrome c biogenesis protein CcdA